MNASGKRVIRWSLAVVILGGLGLLVSDCDDLFEAHPHAIATRPAVAEGPGVVEGSVRFSGPIPPVKIIGGENECCPGATPAPDETTVVNSNGTLKNVVVYIKEGPNIAGEESAPKVLDQKDCRYVPHVLALRTGQPLDVTNHDPTMHNVYLQATANPAQNFSENGTKATHRLSFAAPEFINVKCAVHPWMSAYVCVLDHPCFAVTGDDGRFKIDRLPVGSYTLIAWHEKYGKLERTIHITDDKPVQISFEYKAPGS